VVNLLSSTLSELLSRWDDGDEPSSDDEPNEGSLDLFPIFFVDSGL